MHDVQVQTEKDVKAFLSQFETKELEAFQREIPGLLALRKTVDKKAREIALLQRLNEECALPEKHWVQFNALSEKKDKIDLTPKEWKAYFRLIEEERKLQLKRILILGELAQLRGVSLEEIADELGINPPGHAE